MEIYGQVLILGPTTEERKERRLERKAEENERGMEKE